MVEFELFTIVILTVEIPLFRKITNLDCKE